MIAKLIPGPRNEELISVLLAAKATMTEEEFEEFVLERMSDSENCLDYMDALYYTSENGAATLKEQEDYFLERLVLDEKYHYAERMCGLDFGI